MKGFILAPFCCLETAPNQFSFMKKVILSFLMITGFVLGGYTQDAYHSSLQTFLQTDYNLPAGSWIFYDSETAILNNSTSFGNITTTETVVGQEFTQSSKIQVTQVPANVYGSQWFIQNKQAIQAGDVILATFFIRGIGERAKLSFFIENATTYNKEVYLTMPADTQWRRFLIPFEASSNFGVNGLTFGLHLGYQVQDVQFGGLTAINYGKSVGVGDLPEKVNNEFYDGWEPNAAWRADAAVRIDSLRKADLSIVAKDAMGNPVENAGFEVKMLQHEFGFGSAVTAERIAGNNGQNNIYENKIINLDGNGHGFNWVVFENDMKWPAWEDNWFVSNTELANAVTWLRNEDITVRGHVLLWPGYENLPSDIEVNKGDLAYVKNRINTHISTILNYSGIAGQVDEWDMLNEIITNDDLENLFKGTPGYPTGREIYTEVYNQAKAQDSTVGMWVNDYITMTLQQEAGSPQYDELKSHIQEMLNAGVDLEGIGFQGHLGGFPNGIPSVLNTLDDFYNAFGLKAKITEFDLPTFVNEVTAATYLKDFMTAIYSHPSVDGFLFWNFWDGAFWLNSGTNLFNLDWSYTPSGDTFVNLVFDEWWTDELLTTDMTGAGSVRGFKGKYEISYTCDGVIVRDTVVMAEDLTVNITCDNVTTGLRNEFVNTFEIMPNPSTGFVQIIQPGLTPADMTLLDVNGRVVLIQSISENTTSLNLSHLPDGMYLIRLQTDQGIQIEKLILR